MSSNANNPVPVGDYPCAEVALEFGLADGFPAINNFNWVYNDPLPVNFTAVEIITFLPTLHRNYWIACRFINNGISNGQHHEIFGTHRNQIRSIVSDISSIGKDYLNAMRPRNWRSLPIEQQKALWKRKSHRTPEWWNRDCIVMNGFQPDDSEPAPAVPIISLLQNVKKIPQGADAADLTRVINFAAQNRATGADGEMTEYMFPDDLPFILNLIGRTPVGPYYMDCSISARYGRLRRDRMAAENSARETENATSIAGTTAESTETNHLVKWSDVNSFNPAVAVSPYSPLLTSDVQPSNQNTLITPQEVQMAAPLDNSDYTGAFLRNYAGNISPQNQSTFAQAVRFSQQKDQIGQNWSTKDLDTIAVILCNESMLDNSQNQNSNSQVEEF